MNDLVSFFMMILQSDRQIYLKWGFSRSSVSKESTCHAGDMGSMGLEDLLEKEMTTHSTSCLENPMDRGAWQATVHGVAESRI